MCVQLVLIGGRSSVPNLLTVLYQKPATILALTSFESTGDFPGFERLVKQVFPACDIEELPPVDAFDYEAISARCSEAFQRFPREQWICNITASTAVMSIAAYEQARKLDIACWYLNTARARVIALVGQKIDLASEKALFRLKVQQYSEACACSLEDGDLEERREKCQQEWLPFARMLGYMPVLATHLREVMLAISRSKQQRPKKDRPKDYSFPGLSQEAHDILKEAECFGLAENVRSANGLLSLTLDSVQDSFLNGGWLELYVWHEASQAQLPDGHPTFDDCQWNHKITISGTQRELDVALTHRAQLLIAECKTGDDTTRSDTLHGLVSVANPLGGRFVGKILISSLFSPLPVDSEQLQGDGKRREQQAKSQKDFLAKADHSQIVVIMGEDLPRIRGLLTKEALAPRYPRM